MQIRWKVLIVTLVIAIPAFMLTAGAPLGGTFWNALWPFEAPSQAPEPTSAQLPLFMLMGAIEAIALGLAGSFLVFGWPLVRTVAGGARRTALILYVAIAWVLGNWWAHDSLHQINGENMAGLLVLEYAFHVTLIIAGAYLALNFRRMVDSIPGRTPTPAPTAASATP